MYRVDNKERDYRDDLKNLNHIFPYIKHWSPCLFLFQSYFINIAFEMKLKSYIFIKSWLGFMADDIYLLIRNDTTGFVHLIFCL